jgi:hypothetical protein
VRDNLEKALDGASTAAASARLTGTIGRRYVFGARSGRIEPDHHAVAFPDASRLRASVAKFGIVLALLTGAAGRIVASPVLDSAPEPISCSAAAPDVLRPHAGGAAALPSVHDAARVTESAGENVDRTVPRTPSDRSAGRRDICIRHPVAAARARVLAIAWLDDARLLAAAHSGPAHFGGAAQPPPANRP